MITSTYRDVTSFKFNIAKTSLISLRNLKQKTTTTEGQEKSLSLIRGKKLFLLNHFIFLTHSFIKHVHIFKSMASNVNIID